MLARASHEFESTQPWHVPVTDHQIESGGRFVKAFQACLSVLGLDELRDFQSLQHSTQHLADRLIILDHQDSQLGEIVWLAHQREPTNTLVLGYNLARDGAHGAALVIVDEAGTLEKCEGNAHPDFAR